MKNVSKTSKGSFKIKTLRKGRLCIKMNILLSVAIFSQASSGLNFHQLARRPTQNDARWKILNEMQTSMNPGNVIDRQNDRRNQILAAFELNHQECDMVFQRGRRRRVQCHDEIPDHGRDLGLFTPFATAAKWFQNRKSDNLLLGNVHE